MVQALLAATQDDEIQIAAQRERVCQLRLRLQPIASPEASSLYALADALVTAHLLLNELEAIRTQSVPGLPPLETLHDLIAWADAPNLLGVCQFGNKHRGTPWSQVPKDYLQWMKREVRDMDPDTRYTVEYYLRQDLPANPRPLLPGR